MGSNVCYGSFRCVFNHVDSSVLLVICPVLPDSLFPNSTIISLVCLTCVPPLMYLILLLLFPLFKTVFCIGSSVSILSCPSCYWIIDLIFLFVDWICFCLHCLVFKLK